MFKTVPCDVSFDRETMLYIWSNSKGSSWCIYLWTVPFNPTFLKSLFLSPQGSSIQFIYVTFGVGFNGGGRAKEENDSIKWLNCKCIREREDALSVFSLNEHARASQQKCQKIFSFFMWKHDEKRGSSPSYQSQKPLADILKKSIHLEMNEY